MSRKGNCWDNASTERFFGSLKREWLADRLSHSRLAVMDDVNNYMTYYNQVRLHSTIDDMSPVQYEKCS